MIERLVNVLRLLITPYMLFLFIVCSLILLYLYKTIPDKKYPIELNMCKYASFTYIGLSIVLFVASFFL